MKKTLKKICSVITIMIFTLSCFIDFSEAKSIYSEGVKVPSRVTKENASQILIDFGIASEEVFQMNENEKIDMAKAILKDPDSVDMSNTVVYFDRLEELETIVNLTDDEMSNSGLSDSDIKYYRGQIQTLRKMSDEELCSEFQVGDEIELRMIREALKPNENYRDNIKALDKTVSSSAIISPSVLELSLRCHSNTYYTNMPVSYRVYSFFRWLQKPLIKNEDQYGIAWGGGLAQTNHTRYYYMTDATPPYLQTVTGAASSSTCLSAIDISPNAGLIHYFRINMNYGSGWSFDYMMGFTYVTIFQNQKQNLTADLVAKYAHKTLFISGAGLSISTSGGSASLNCSWGYSYAYPNPLNIVY